MQKVAKKSLFVDSPWKIFFAPYEKVYRKNTKN
jgi:hypothetical protein